MMKPSLIAPCGMNCNLCIAYLRKRNACPGCRESDAYKSVSCIRCFIKNCEIRIGRGWRYCSDKCPEYPCERLRHLDKRYRAKYGMSMIENLGYIGLTGIRMFIRHEEKRWVKGGKIFCVHRKTYYPQR
jgi:hypothetical protein